MITEEYLACPFYCKVQSKHHMSLLLISILSLNKFYPINWTNSMIKLSQNIKNPWRQANRRRIKIYQKKLLKFGKKLLNIHIFSIEENNKLYNFKQLLWMNSKSKYFLTQFCEFGFLFEYKKIINTFNKP